MSVHEVREKVAQRTSHIVRTVRAEAGLTQAAVSVLFGCTARQVQQWETGAIIPRIDTLAAFLEMFGHELTISFRKVQEDEYE